MEKFNITIDEKCTIWHRTTLDVEADTKEKAIEEIKDRLDIEGTILNGFHEWLHDTAESMNLSENDGFSTIEVYSDITGDPDYKNGK